MIMANSHLFFLLFLLLLFSLHAIAASAQPGFVSIDCGSSDENYTDTMGITWVSDDSYIYTGENKVVQTPNSVSKVLSTLRVFSTRKRNCYSIPFTNGTHVLVRASFYYGNYDQISSPPTFDLYFEGNFWTTVDTSINNNLISYETMYAVRNGAISICLVQTLDQLPFISALEVRALNSTMYPYVDFSTNALFQQERIAYGANQTIRYPYDQYDRLWVAQGPTSRTTTVISGTAVIHAHGFPDKPPSIVLQNALTTSDAKWRSLILNTNLPNYSVNVYINMYFNEVAVLDKKTQQRAFHINVDGFSLGSDPIVPIYAGITEMSLYNNSASSNDTFSLVSTSNSTLPPLINALEVFIVSDPLVTGTDSVDVEQLSLLQAHFPVLAEWSGDPCLPDFYSWEWVQCTVANTPRVIALYLSGFGLNGTIPDLSYMDALEAIDLHNNSLTGEIPASLANIPNLQELNLADNNLTGTVPASLYKNSMLTVDVSGNPNLCITSCSVPPSSATPPSDMPSNSTETSPSDAYSGSGTSSIAPSNSAGTPPNMPSTSTGTTPSYTSITPSTSSPKKSNNLPIILGVTALLSFFSW